MSIFSFPKFGRSGVQGWLQFPLLVLVVSILLIEFFFYLLVRLFAFSYEAFVKAVTLFRFQHASLFEEMETAATFDEWQVVANKLDVAENRQNFKIEDESSCYDYQLVRSLLDRLQSAVSKKDMSGLMNILMGLYNKNMCQNTVDNVNLYNHTYCGTKNIICDYVDFLNKGIETVTDSSEAELPLLSKVAFLKRAQKVFGNTALCLSGGATLAYFHFGVIRALIEADCMPTIISGASGGSMIGAWLSVRSDSEILETFTPDLHVHITPCRDSWFVRFSRLIKTGAMFDWQEWIDLTKIVTMGDFTFQEAFKKTGRIFNISVTSKHKHSSSIVLNYLTAPNVVIWSAVLASSAIPLVLNNVTLFKKNEHGIISPFHDFGICFADGSIKNDLPFKQLTESFNVNYFIVSQVNPHLVPMVFFNCAQAGEPSSRISGSKLRGGFIFSSLEIILRLEMRKWIQILVDLDLMMEVFGIDWRQALLQPACGDITILPTTSLCDYINILDDPTRESLARYLKVGARSVWPRLTMIRNHMLLENALKKAVSKLQVEK